jgi:hypothetical protein
LEDRVRDRRGSADLSDLRAEIADGPQRDANDRRASVAAAGISGYVARSASVPSGGVRSAALPGAADQLGRPVGGLPTGVLIGRRCAR